MPVPSAPLVTIIKPSRLVPELDPKHNEPWDGDSGTRKLLVKGMRIVELGDGTTVRADQRFPRGHVQARSLPERLGGGYLFYQIAGGGTHLWRAADWTARLEPLTSVSMNVKEVIPAFDALYVREQGGQRLLAIDASSGALRKLGALPTAGAYGAMAFADGWRGVVDTDLRGPMATFDAGASWHALGLKGGVNGAMVLDGDPVLQVSGGTVRLDATGKLQFLTDEDEPEPEVEESESRGSTVGASQVLGGRPLRQAVLRGWPDTRESAIVAHRGALVRVGLPSGKVLAAAHDAFVEDDATCQGVRLGKGFGFVCGQPGGETVIYAFLQPLGLREVARFAKPRFVSSSGNGALVVRGNCSSAAASAAAETRTYCVIGLDGRSREIGVRGDVGAERVVALSDGRIVVLVPPRLGARGRITTISGDKLQSVELAFPKEPRRAVRIARRGLWLEGFQQRDDKSVGGWVEAGGPVVGVRVGLDGKVKVGKVYDHGGQVLVSGSFALGIAETEVGFESTDGGKSWREFELPSLPASKGDPKTRGCSPVGCAVRGWLRVGWGKSEAEDDLEMVELPSSVDEPITSSRPLRFECAYVSTSRKRPKGMAPIDENTLRMMRYRDEFVGTWGAFGNRPAPKLPKDAIGVDRGSNAWDSVPTHVYVWGPKGADWTRVGWWLVRFDDRFDPDGGIRESARARSPWMDEVAATEAIGARYYYRHQGWQAYMDPSGQAALVSSCQGSGCALYDVADGRPTVILRNSAGRPGDLRSPSGSVVRLGEVWLYLTEMGSSLELWRVELGIARRLATLPRLRSRHYATGAAPRLVRRALGGEVGLLITVPPDRGAGVTMGTLAVLPIDLSSGALGEPIELVPADLAGKVPPACSAEQDGWLVDTALPTSPVIRIPATGGYLDTVEFRLRLDPAGNCIESIAGRGSSSVGPAADTPGRRPGRAPAVVVPPAGEIPMAVRRQDTEERLRFSCKPD